MKKILALKNDGTMSYCSAPPEKRGMGRCNHIDHQRYNETNFEFLKRVDKNNQMVQQLSIYKKFQKLQQKSIQLEENNKTVQSFNKMFSLDDLTLDDIKIYEDQTDLKVNYILEQYKHLNENGLLEEPEDIDAPLNTYKSIMEYGKIVVDFADDGNKMRQTMTKQEYQENFTALDRKRRNAHNKAMSNINMMNNLNKIYGLEPFYSKIADDEHRTDVTADILETMKENINNF